MNQHKIKYILSTFLLIVSFSSESEIIERKTYSFTTNFPTTLLLSTKERVNVKFSVSWNICKPKMFSNYPEEFNESTIKNEIYMRLWNATGYESSLHTNNDFLKKDPAVIGRIKEKFQAKISELGICIETLKITKI